MKTYKIVLRSMGGTKHDYVTDLTYDEALKICENHNWVIAPEGAYVWDMEIEEVI